MADPLSFRWSPEFLALVDERRGAVSRSAYVRECLEQRWEREGLATEAPGLAAESTGAATPGGSGLVSPTPAQSTPPRVPKSDASPPHVPDRYELAMRRAAERERKGKKR
jgi:hypothetical protein